MTQRATSILNEVRTATFADIISSELCENRAMTAMDFVEFGRKKQETLKKYWFSEETERQACQAFPKPTYSASRAYTSETEGLSKNFCSSIAVIVIFIMSILLAATVYLNGLTG